MFRLFILFGNFLYELSFLSGVFFQQVLLKAQNYINQGLQPSLHIQEGLTGVFAETSLATLENLSNLL